VGDYMLPLGEARCVRPGSDVTLVTWGAQVGVCGEWAREGGSRWWGL
jgi:pyruvate/2-oxoglutarate/acetoin dehydrogenase E1 component